MEYRNSVPEDHPLLAEESKMAAYVQELQSQHAIMLDDVIAHHLLWAPELIYPIIEAMGVVRTIIRLNDGRECEVITCSTTGETTASQWKKAA